MTKNAVITDVERDVKMLLASPWLIPSVAIDDPLLTVSLPPFPTMATGLDALTHAIEAYVSRRAQPITDVLVPRGDPADRVAASARPGRTGTTSTPGRR